MAHGQTLGRKYSAQKPNPAPIRLHHTMAGRSGLNPLPGSTAGCGKPHVRWCGRVTARNHCDPTRSIVFSEMATNNHFVLDRGGKTFKNSAPVIKLASNATETDHLVLLGLLNSSTA